MTKNTPMGWESLQAAIEDFVADMEGMKKSGHASFRISGSIGQPVVGKNVKMSGKVAGHFVAWADRLKRLT